MFFSSFAIVCINIIIANGELIQSERTSSTNEKDSNNNTRTKAFAEDTNTLLEDIRSLQNKRIFSGKDFGASLSHIPNKGQETILTEIFVKPHRITSEPSLNPSPEPSFLPSMIPSSQPTSSSFPTKLPSSEPSIVSSAKPSLYPSTSPSKEPSQLPSSLPSSIPSFIPSTVPSLDPSSEPSILPSRMPSEIPTSKPTLASSSIPTSLPSYVPTVVPSLVPSLIPSNYPSHIPSESPTVTTEPSIRSSTYPSLNPTNEPSSFQVTTSKITGKTNGRGTESAVPRTGKIVKIVVPVLLSCTLFGIAFFITSKYFASKEIDSDDSTNNKSDDPDHKRQSTRSGDLFHPEEDLDGTQSGQNIFGHLDRAIAVLKTKKGSQVQFRETVEDIERNIQMLKNGDGSSVMHSDDQSESTCKDRRSMWFKDEQSIKSHRTEHSYRSYKKFNAIPEIISMNSSTLSIFGRDYEVIKQTESKCGSRLWREEEGWEAQLPKL